MMMTVRKLNQAFNVCRAQPQGNSYSNLLKWVLSSVPSCRSGNGFLERLCVLCKPINLGAEGPWTRCVCFPMDHFHPLNCCSCGIPLMALLRNRLFHWRSFLYHGNGINMYRIERGFQLTHKTQTSSVQRFNRLKQSSTLTSLIAI